MQLFVCTEVYIVWLVAIGAIGALLETYQLAGKLLFDIWCGGSHIVKQIQLPPKLSYVTVSCDITTLCDAVKLHS